MKIENFNNVITSNNCMFLCGNGFSMNFDSGFSNIMDRLYEAHKILLREGKYEVNANKTAFKKKCLDNYESVISYLRRFNKDQLYEIFADGLEFGKRVLADKELKSIMFDRKLINELQINVNEFSILEELVNSWKIYGINGINIEYFSILTYFYFAVGEIKIREYDMEFNKFIKVVRLGDINKTSFIQKVEGLKDTISESIILNGFTTYYRLLFCIAIFNNKKSIELKNMDKIDNLNLPKIIGFLSKFDNIITANYDKILENLIGENRVEHLHGEFKVDNEDFIYYQKLYLNIEDKHKVSFSNILIGDYIYNKTMRSVINGLSSELLDNKKVVNPNKLLEDDIKKNSINTIFIFGLNANNDQHILRSFMTGFYFAKIENPKIIYSYFVEEDKNAFDRIFNECITYSEDLNEYSRKINIEYIKTQDIIQYYFK